MFITTFPFELIAPLAVELLPLTNVKLFIIKLALLFIINMEDLFNPLII
ncbi:MAG: hypothetical protein PUC09_05040 [Methanobrevibacter wolinii]|nr:hypothetical protein [Methanobrevibacter wolinii]